MLTLTTFQVLIAGKIQGNATLVDGRGVATPLQPAEDGQPDPEARGGGYVASLDAASGHFRWVSLVTYGYSLSVRTVSSCAGGYVLIGGSAVTNTTIARSLTIDVEHGVGGVSSHLGLIAMLRSDDGSGVWARVVGTPGYGSPSQVDETACLPTPAAPSDSSASAQVTADEVTDSAVVYISAGSAAQHIGEAVPVGGAPGENAGKLGVAPGTVVAHLRCKPCNAAC